MHRLLIANFMRIIAIAHEMMMFSTRNAIVCAQVAHQNGAALRDRRPLVGRKQAPRGVCVCVCAEGQITQRGNNDDWHNDLH